MASTLQRKDLPNVIELQASAWAEAGATLRSDLEHGCRLLGTALGASQLSTFTLAITEPKIYQHYVSTLRILPRGVEQPKDGEQRPLEDPGPAGPDSGKPWRPFSAIERSLLLVLYVDARWILWAISLWRLHRQLGLHPWTLQRRLCWRS